MIYNKIPKTPEELADKLISINLKGITKEQLSNILTNISYYRLKGYIYPYINNNCGKKIIQNGITWNHI